MSVALITGCSSGFGLLSAIRLAQGEMTVVATMRDLERGTALSEACIHAGVEVEVERLDVTDSDSIARVTRAVLDRHGRIDILINNAGYGLQGAVEATTIAQAQALFETNFFGTLRMIQAVLPIMRNQQTGVIVNISSLAALVTNPFSGLYSASKSALESLSEALHYEVSPYGIRVAIIEPGSFPTSFDNRVTAEAECAEVYSKRLARWGEAYGRLPGKDTPADPSLVAQAVYEAVTDEDFPLRRLVGQDAELIAALRAELDDGSFEATVRATLDFWD